MSEHAEEVRDEPLNDTESVNGSVETSAELDTEETPSRPTFEDRASDMGLIIAGEGCFSYSDQWSEVAYRTLHTKGGAEIMDDYEVQQLAVFTRALEGEWKQVGIVSNLYQFVGNGALIDLIKESIEEVGSPVFLEETYQSANLAQLRHEIVVQNSTNVPQVGDIYPMMVIGNGYDGTRAANISFGLFFNDSDNINVSFGSKKKFGNLRQVHLVNANTELSTSLGEYVTAFSANIAEMVSVNFNNAITSEDMLRTLDLIEEASGRRRRDAISTIISEQYGEEDLETISITSWNLFHAITKFSTVERNLNAKLILEDVAERVLVIPTQMADALSAISA